MRGLWGGAVVSVVLGFALVGAGMAQERVSPPDAAGPSFHLGLGAKMLGGTPFVLAAARYGPLAVDAGAGLRFSEVTGTNVMLFWYNILGKYYVDLPWEFVVPYAGGGAVGISASATLPVQGVPVGVSISSLGGHVTAGIEFRLGQFVVFLGGDWLLLTEMRISAAGLSLSVPIAYGGAGYHLGLRYDF